MAISPAIAESAFGDLSFTSATSPNKNKVTPLRMHHLHGQRLNRSQCYRLYLLSDFGKCAFTHVKASTENPQHTCKYCSGAFMRLVFRTTGGWKITSHCSVLPFGGNE